MHFLSRCLIEPSDWSLLLATLLRGGGGIVWNMLSAKLCQMVDAYLHKCVCHRILCGIWRNTVKHTLAIPYLHLLYMRSLLLRVVHSLTAPANYYSHKSMALVIGSMSRSHTCIHTLLLHSHSNSHPLPTGAYNVSPARVQVTGVRKPPRAKLGVWIVPRLRSNTTWDGVATYHDTDSHNSSKYQILRATFLIT